ncbi:MAG TPA: signal peptidase I [Acholeplasma sp.]|nr:signal peptidase I [Acholeplasma sp.]
MKKTLNIIGTILISIIILFTLTFVVLSVVSFVNKKPIKIMGYGYGVVETQSMTPMIVPGDFVIIQEQATYEIGDVIAYTSVEGITVVHQIIAETSFGFETKGINNEFSDVIREGYITLDRIQGKVTWYGGHELGYLIIDNRATLIGLSVILIGIVFIMQVVSVIKQKLAQQKLEHESDLEKLKEEVQKELEQSKENKQD